MPREKGKPAASRAEQREGWRTGWRARFKKGEGKSVSAWKICCSQNDACTSFYLFSSPLFSLSLFLLISSFLLSFFSFWLFLLSLPLPRLGFRLFFLFPRFICSSTIFHFCSCSSAFASANFICITIWRVLCLFLAFDYNLFGTG